MFKFVPVLIVSVSNWICADQQQQLLLAVSALQQLQSDHQNKPDPGTPPDQDEQLPKDPLPKSSDQKVV